MKKKLEPLWLDGHNLRCQFEGEEVGVGLLGTTQWSEPSGCKNTRYRALMQRLTPRLVHAIEMETLLREAAKNRSARIDLFGDYDGVEDARRKDQRLWRRIRRLLDLIAEEEKGVMP